MSTEPKETPKEILDSLSEPSDRKSGFRMDPNMIIAIALAIISLCALFVSIYQTKILAEEQALNIKAEKAQLWPRISTSFGGRYKNDQYEQLSFSIENEGTGPAIIESFVLIYKDRNYKNWSDLLNAIIEESGQENTGRTLTARDATNTILQSGEKNTLFDLSAPDPSSFKNVFKAFEGDDCPEFVVCYKSVFDDYWYFRGSLHDDCKPEGIEACEAG